MRSFIYFAALATAVALPGAAIAGERVAAGDIPCAFGDCLAGGKALTSDMVAPVADGFSLRRSKMVRPGARPARMAGARRLPARAAPAGPRADLMLSFNGDSAELTDPARDRAKMFAQALNSAELRASRFVIEGHTDAVGSRAASRDLSRRRAQSVADFLVSQGVDRSRLQVEGVGPDRPLPGKPPRSAENDRVEAALIS